jgi:hypothetical protein
MNKYLCAQCTVKKLCAPEKVKECQINKNIEILMKGRAKDEKR